VRAVELILKCGIYIYIWRAKVMELKHKALVLSYPFYIVMVWAVVKVVTG